MCAQAMCEGQWTAWEVGSVCVLFSLTLHRIFWTFQSALGFLEVLLTGQALHTRDKPPTLTPRVNSVPITLYGAPVALSPVPGRHWMMPLLPPLGPEG